MKCSAANSPSKMRSRLSSNDNWGAARLYHGSRASSISFSMRVVSLSAIPQKNSACQPLKVATCHCCSTHHRRDLHQRDGLDLQQNNDELRPNVAAGFIPCYVIIKYSFQPANGLRRDPFKKCLATNLVKDSGTVASYAASKDL